MWTKILEYAQTLIFLQRETQQNKSDIKDCEQEPKKANATLRNFVPNLINLF